MKFTGCGLHVMYSNIMHVLHAFSSAMEWTKGVSVKQEVVVTSVYIVQSASNVYVMFICICLDVSLLIVS